MTPRPLLTIQDRDPAVLEIRRILKHNGYDVSTEGPDLDVLDELLFSQVEVFQLQHLGPDGAFLIGDGETIDVDTWWALDNPVGEAQESGHKAIADRELTEGRSRLLEMLAAEHAKNVHEIPDGSNRSPEIDGYWGNTGLLPKDPKQPGLAWCCAFVSTMLKRTLGYYPIGGVHHVGVQRMFQAARDTGIVVVKPKPGDVFIQIKSQGQGHTGFVTGVSEDGLTVATCGGNEGNRLKNGRRLVSTIQHFIDPIDDGQGLDFTRIPNAAATIGASEATR
jgi:hypothetical protein